MIVAPRNSIFPLLIFSAGVLAASALSDDAPSISPSLESITSMIEMRERLLKSGMGEISVSLVLSDSGKLMRRTGLKADANRYTDEYVRTTPLDATATYSIAFAINKFSIEGDMQKTDTDGVSDFNYMQHVREVFDGEEYAHYMIQRTVNPDGGDGAESSLAEIRERVLPSISGISRRFLMPNIVHAGPQNRTIGEVFRRCLENDHANWQIDTLETEIRKIGADLILVVLVGAEREHGSEEWIYEFDCTRGFVVLKSQSYLDGNLRIRMTTQDLVQTVDGVWLPRSQLHESWNASGVPMVTIDTRYGENFRIGIPVPESVYRPQFPPGLKVVNYISGVVAESSQVDSNLEEPSLAELELKR